MTLCLPTFPHKCLKELSKVTQLACQESFCWFYGAREFIFLSQPNSNQLRDHPTTFRPQADFRNSTVIQPIWMMYAKKIGSHDTPQPLPPPNREIPKTKENYAPKKYKKE